MAVAMSTSLLRPMSKHLGVGGKTLERPVSFNDLRFQRKEVENHDQEFQRRSSLDNDSRSYQFATHEGTQYHNTGNGSQFLATQFYGDVKFISHVENSVEQLRQDKEVQLLNRLSTCPYQSRKDRNPSAYRGTCEWFIAHQEFHKWLNSKSSNIIWVSADPGCGNVTYFFFKDDFQDQKDIINALCCILKQILSQDRGLITDDLILRFEDSNGQWTLESFSELWQTFIQVIRDNPHKEFICLLDAIDECDTSGRQEFFKAITNLYGNRKCPNLKMLITSRPYQEISTGFLPLEGHGLPVIHLSGESDTEMEKIAREIDIVIRERAKEIATNKRLMPAEQDILMKRLFNVQHRTYLWVHLTLDIIDRELDINATTLDNITSRLPQTVEEAYDKIMSRSRNAIKATKMLHLILAARRPLTLTEIFKGLPTTSDHYAANYWADHFNKLPLNVQTPLLESAMTICNPRSACYSLWFAVHWGSNRGSLPGNFTTLMTASYFGIDIVVKQLLKARVNDLDQQDSFYQRSALSWAAGRGHEGVSAKLIRGMSMSQRIWKINLTSGADVNLKDKDGRTPIFYAVWSGNVEIVQRLVKEGASINIRDILGVTPVTYAVSNGNHEVVKILLEAGGSSLADTDVGTRLLISAIHKSQQQVVKQLIEAGNTDVNARDKNGTTLLLLAVDSKDVTIVKLLLKGSADVNIGDNDGWTPLLQAVKYGDQALVQLLLDSGAAINTADGDGRTPLTLAIVSHHDGIVQLMLWSCQAKVTAEMEFLIIEQCGCETLKLLLSRYEVDLNARNENGDTLLISTIKGGWIDKCKVLLRSSSIDINGQDKGGNTALHYAVDAQDEGMVSLLLAKQDVNINARNGKGRTPIALACSNASFAIVRMLLDTDQADVNIPDSTGGVPLVVAAYQGEADIVQLLLETGKTNVNMVDNEGRTALASAAVNGHEEAVRILLGSSQVQVNLVDTYGLTPLSLAASEEHANVVRILLDTAGVDTEVEDHTGRTALALAAMKGDVKIVEMLLHHRRASMYLANHHCRIAWLLAAEQGREDVIRLLLDLGYSDVDTRDGRGRTALSLAAGAGQEGTVRLLLDYGHVNVNVRDDQGNKADWWAAVHLSENWRMVQRLQEAMKS
ncbi:hypothetical protein HG530_003960 [Fusarium avenaceum]|nr:hypothetical protein HG530_003960 [Fusarium avenaceum]